MRFVAERNERELHAGDREPCLTLLITGGRDLSDTAWFYAQWVNTGLSATRHCAVFGSPLEAQKLWTVGQCMCYVPEAIA